MIKSFAPLISVVMIVRNGEQYLKRAVDSILEQQGVTLDLIVTDDGSTDSTPTILHSYDDPRLIVLRNEESVGPTRALNQGANVAQGKLIARMDGDDISLPGRLKKQAAFFDEHDEVVMISSQVNLIDTKGDIIYEGRYPVRPYILNFLFLLTNPYWHPAAMFRRRVFEAVGGYNENFVYAQDYDLWTRMQEQGQLAILDEVMLHYRQHQKSITQSKFLRQEMFAAQIIKRKLEEFASREYSDADIYGMREILQRLPVVHVSEKAIDMLTTLLAEYVERHKSDDIAPQDVIALTQRVADDLLNLAHRGDDPELRQSAQFAASQLRECIARDSR